MITPAKLFLILVLSVLLLVPQTSFALTACQKKETGEGSDFTETGAAAPFLSTGIEVWNLGKNIEHLRSVGLTMAVIGLPIAFYGLYVTNKEPGISSGCKEKKRKPGSRKLKRENIKILADEKSEGVS